MARRQEVARPACHLEFGGDATPAHAAALQAEAEANLVAAGRALLHPALGAAVTAVAAYESHQRKQRGIKEKYTVADAVQQLVRFGSPVDVVDSWRADYERGLKAFRKNLRGS